MRTHLSKIMFVDDDSDFLESTKLLLELKGHQIDTAESIGACLQKIKRHRYEIAILDLRMPGLTEPVWGGMDAISTLIRFDPLIQVIVLTGYSSKQREIEAIRKGAFAFVAKKEPIVENLDETIRYAHASRRSMFSRNQMVQLPFAEKVSKFCDIHPYDKNVFIMMRYYDGVDIFESIETKIKQTLNRHKLKGHLAKDKSYCDDLWDNVRVYMHSCKYGLAVFEEIKESAFNPNISLEIGYMYAMGKECLLLKEKKVPKLPTDICGKLYKSFDSEKLSTLTSRVRAWAKEKV